MATHPDAQEILGELDAGVVMSKLGRALADVSLGVVEYGRKGKVVLTLDLDRIGETAQVTVAHTVSFVKPTLRGKSSEEDRTSTPMYVNQMGNLSVVPDGQMDLFKKERS